MKQILFLSIILPVVFAASFNTRVLKTDVQSIVFKKAQLTTGRRIAPIQQMICIGAHCTSHNLATSAICRNQGHDEFGNINWECDVVTPNGFKVGDTFVSCEGYDYADDRYILAGSCSLTYELLQDQSHRHNMQSQPTQTVVTTTTHTHHGIHNYDVYGSYDFGDFLIYFAICILILPFCFVLLCARSAIVNVQPTPLTYWSSPVYSFWSRPWRNSSSSTTTTTTTTSTIPTSSSSTSSDSTTSRSYATSRNR